MTDDAQLAATQATVLTDRPERYGKQLVSHLGRKKGGQWSPETRSGTINLSSGQATVTAKDGELHLRIVASAAELPRLEDVVGRHLVRFGQRDELTVTWERAGA